MSDEAIVATALCVVGFITWLFTMSYRIGRVYTLLVSKLRQHDKQLEAHERRISAVERGTKPRPAAS